MLAGERTRGKRTVTSRDEAEDHNTGVSMLRGLHAYLHGQSRARLCRQRGACLVIASVAFRPAWSLGP
jgi:hypothetical protein